MGGVLSRRKKLSLRKSRVHKRPDKNIVINDNEADKEDGVCTVFSLEVNSPQIQSKILMKPTLLDTPNFDFRIEPVEKEGARISETHYFLLEEPKYRRCHSTKDRCNPLEMYANSSRLFNQYNEEPTLPFEMNTHITHDHIVNSLPIRRGRSDTTDYVYNQQRALVARMRLNIPQATDLESHGVLMGTNWNFPEAERRLKVELVHRQNGANFKQCQSILMEHDWNLEKALKSITMW